MVEHLRERSARLEHVASLNRGIAYRSMFEELLLTFLDLAPRRDRTGTRDGRRAEMIRALDYRASYFQITDWRKDRRAAPQWARELLETKLAKRHATIARLLKSKTAGD